MAHILRPVWCLTSLLLVQRQRQAMHRQRVMSLYLHDADSEQNQTHPNLFQLYLTREWQSVISVSARLQSLCCCNTRCFVEQTAVFVANVKQTQTVKTAKLLNLQSVTVFVISFAKKKHNATFAKKKRKTHFRDDRKRTFCQN